jgi:hypothetical protein
MKCTRLSGRHQYEARYDETPNPLLNNGSATVTGSTSEGTRALMILRVYVHDICVICGDVIKRSP